MVEVEPPMDHIGFKLALSFFCYKAEQTSVVLLRVRLSAARELLSVAVRLNVLHWVLGDSTSLLTSVPSLSRSF